MQIYLLRTACLAKFEHAVLCRVDNIDCNMQRSMERGSRQNYGRRPADSFLKVGEDRWCSPGSEIGWHPNFYWPILPNLTKELGEGL